MAGAETVSPESDDIRRGWVQMTPDEIDPSVLSNTPPDAVNLENLHNRYRAEKEQSNGRPAMTSVRIPHYNRAS